MQNIDQICAECGFEFAEKIGKANPKKAEKVIIDALSVLQEQGLYAFVLFCRSKSDAKELENLAKKLLSKLNLIKDSETEEGKSISTEAPEHSDSTENSDDLLSEVRKSILTDIDKLIFAISVLEKSLIYAKFHVKAMGKSRGERG